MGFGVNIMRKTSSVIRSKTQARHNYNSLSRWYDFLAGSSEERFRRMGIKALSVQPGERVLEIGFGTGKSMMTIADLVGSGGEVYGIDLSEGMASVTQERIKNTLLGARVSLCLADGAFPPFKNSYFDVVVMSFTLELFDTPEIPLVLSESRRVLRPGGRLGVVALQKTPSPGYPERIYEWFHHQMPVLVDCRPIEVEACIEHRGFVIQSQTSAKMWGLPVSIVSAVCPENENGYE